MASNVVSSKSIGPRAKLPGDARSTMGRRQWILLGLVIGTFTIGGWWWRLGTAPQLGDDAAVMKTADALFTALTSRDEARLNGCAEQVHQLTSSGQLTKPASAKLMQIIALGRRGEWRAAAEQHYALLTAQRGAR